MSASSTDFAYPSDPALYRGHLCNVLTIPSTSSDVVDLTGYIECGTFIASGGYGQVFQGKWKDVGGVALANSDVLPSVAVKVVSVPPLRDEKEKEKRLKVSAGLTLKVQVILIEIELSLEDEAGTCAME
jgi:hypothetical protein